MAEKLRKIPVYQPLVGHLEATAVARVLASRWLTQGPEVAAFEKEFAEFVGAPEACAVSNGTTALHLALMAVGVVPGDEVITVSHSFIATANSICHAGGTPVFVDVKRGTLNIDSEQVESAITPRTRAILCVHQVGMPCDLRTLGDISRRHGLKLIEDAACAVGSEILWDGQWERIGSARSDAVCFSFHPRKLLTTGEGGMITTRSSELAQRVRLLRQHGMSTNDRVRHDSNRVVFEEYEILGYNFRMSDLNAAVGREQLKLLPGVVQRRREQVQVYRDKLAGIPGLLIPQDSSETRSNWQSFWIGLPDGVDQRQFMQAALDLGISFRRGIMCAHREAPYRKTLLRPLPESERATDRSVIVPLYHEMSASDQEFVIQYIRKACGANG